MSETQPTSASDPPLTQSMVDRVFHDTTAYWLGWLQRFSYKGRWREAVQRAVLCLKLLTFAPTGAIVAAPTFSLPEDLNGAGRNWDCERSLALNLQVPADTSLVHPNRPIVSSDGPGIRFLR